MRVQWMTSTICNSERYSFPYLFIQYETMRFILGSRDFFFWMAQTRSFSSLRLEAHLISSQGDVIQVKKNLQSVELISHAAGSEPKLLSTYRCGSKEFSNLIDFFVVSRSNYTDSTGRSNTRPHLRTFLFYRLVVQSGPAESIVKMMSKSQGST